METEAEKTAKNQLKREREKHCGIVDVIEKRVTKECFEICSIKMKNNFEIMMNSVLKMVYEKTEMHKNIKIFSKLLKKIMKTISAKFV